MEADERKTLEQLLLVLAVGGVVAKVAGLFDDKKPGGDVTPNPGDTRPATFSEVYAQSVADAIADAVWGGGIVAQPYERDADIAAALMLCKVTNDVALLMNAYGEQGQYLSPLNLSQTVAEYLDADYKAAVNADYASKSILLQWA